MAERGTPQVYSIAAHRGFADALVAGLVPRYAEPRFGLARLTLLLPSGRAVRTVTEAFVRASGAGGPSTGSGRGLLLPRMAAVGDLDLDETLGPLLDPIGAGAPVPPAADPSRRWLRLAEMLREEEGYAAASLPALLRLARSMARSMDRLAVEGIAAGELVSDRVRDLFPDLAGHWQENTRLFARVQARWSTELAERGELDPPERRNRLLDHAARRWRASPPPHAVVAAGVTSASPAVARLLRVVSELPRGAVILPDLDLSLEQGVWDGLGAAGAPSEPDDPPFARDDAVTHPQYHLKLLLNRMGVAREEVRPWHRSGEAAAPPERSRAISSLFLPPSASASWIELPPERRRLSGVRLMACADPEEEAQAVALLVREALETPERRVSVITPDRTLAARIVAHLARWNIAADDSAGRPLAQSAAGRLFLLLADCVAERFAPGPLLALLGHPLVRAGEPRAAWLEGVRALDRALRGPRPAPGLAGIEGALAAPHVPRTLREWWREASIPLQPREADEAKTLSASLDGLAAAGEALAGVDWWSQPDGRALAAWFEDVRSAAASVDMPLDPRELSAVLHEAMAEAAVRPPWGGHPRVAIYGLLEARMSRAELVICAGLVEGTWPAAAALDPILAPPLLRALGVPGADFRIGLSAHDLAGALGAPEVVLSHAARDAQGPTIPSRFLLRIRALLGPTLLPAHVEERAVRLAQAIDRGRPAPPYPRPEPRPSAEQRRVAISATALDRLRGDPYQFYALAILGLSTLDALDAEPSAAWKGTAVHAILQAWHDAGTRAGELGPLGARMLAEMSAHPFTKATWQPRLVRALEWIEAETLRLRGEGRAPALWEAKGRIEVDGITIHGRADRIDRLGQGRLGIVDYKTGAPPTNAQVEQGYALQLGVLGLIAARGGFDDLVGTPDHFEYWSLARSKDSETGFGYRCEPIKEGRKLTGLPRGEFLSQTEFFLREALDAWILGEHPFTARLNPDLPNYSDYDQLMRLDEWQARGDAESAA